MALNITTLVIGGDADLLSETLFGVNAQSRPSDQILVLVFSKAQQSQAEKHDLPFLLTSESQVRAIVQGLSSQAKPDWVWLLSYDSCPDPNVLKSLATKAEVSPSAAVVAPKLVDWDHPRIIREYGQSLSFSGKVFSLVENEMDQGQFDTVTDVLGASMVGSLIETDALLEHLSSPSPIAAKGLEIGLSSWSSGRRVLLEPGAKVRITQDHLPLGAKPRLGAEFAKKQSSAYLSLITKPLPVLIIAWIFLPATALVASIRHLVTKKPNLVIAEFLSWVWSWLRLPRIVAGHRRIRAKGQLANLSQLRATREQIKIRSRKRFSEIPMAAPGEQSVGLFGGTWAWLLPLLLLLNYRLWPTSDAVLGGSLLPASADLRNLFEATQSGLVPADPFNWWLLLLGSLSFWQPSLGIAVFLLIAPLLGFAGAWNLLSIITPSNAIRSLGALVYGLSPLFGSALASVSFSEVSAIAILPWFLFSFARLLVSNASPRAWRWSAWSGILLAIISVVSPVLFLVLVPALLVLAISKWRRSGYVLWVLLPAVVINFEYVVFLLQRQPLAVLVSPGFPIAPVQVLDVFAQFGWALILLLPPAVAGLFVKQRLLTMVLLSAVALSVLAIRLLENIEFELITATGFLSSSPTSYSIAALVSITLLVLVANTFTISPKWFRVSSSLLLLPAVLLGGWQLVSTTPDAEFVSSKTAPAIIVAQSKQQEINTLVITQGDPLVLEVIDGDGNHLEDISRLQLLGYQQPANPEQLAELGALLLAGNDQGVSELIAAAEISFVVLKGMNQEQSAELGRLVALDVAGQTEFGDLWRTDFQPKQKASLGATGEQIIILVLLAIYLLLSIPTRASIRGRFKSSDEIFSERDS